MDFVTNVRPTQHIPCNLPAEVLLGMQVYKHYLRMSKTTNVMVRRISKQGENQ